MIYNVVFASGIQQSESVIHVTYVHSFSFRFFSHIGHYRVLSRVVLLCESDTDTQMSYKIAYMWNIK